MEISQLVKDILVPVIAGLLLSTATGAGLVAWWGIRRLVSGQDETNKTLKEISGELAHVNSRTAQLETRETLRDQMATRQHGENQRSIELLWKELGKLKDAKPRGK